MISAADDDPAAQVDALVAAVGPGLSSPAINRQEVVLVTGPWMAGATGVAAALRERLPQHKFVESTDLGPGDAPLAVVFVVSAAAELTESDCALLDAAVDHTDVVIGVVSKIDMHRTWRDVVTANRDALAAHAPRYRQVPWVGAAALPDAGEPQVDDLVDIVSEQLADSDIARRNRLRAWESRLQTAAERFDRDAEGAGRRVRVDALRAQRSTALRERRQSKSERSITLRGLIQQARVQLSYFARNCCSSMRGELQEDTAGLSRRDMPGFEGYARGRAAQVVAEVSDGTARHLAEVAEVMGLPVAPPAFEALPVIDVGAPLLKSRRAETWLMMLLGAGFGLGVALTLGRVVVGLAPGLKAAGVVVCVAIGLALTVVVVNIRGLLRDRAVLDRWASDVTASLRSTVEELVATRVLAVESALSTALAAHDEVENARVADQVSVIDSELREHAIASARAEAARDREMPTVQAALDVVRAELGDPGIPTPEGDEDHQGPAGPEGPSATSESASRSANGDNS
ncbi:hypothetical protein [Mycobacterium haemophilum]|uniref:Uncharacterized protein n=1 Tax=Mycobacterium haemophilum TaxID=29311 RepID=A0A0I9U6Z1_9MYCO|nr:hypothetical protein [Mycobacterium haemophilum]AKN15498.1 hypothetical protein B586_01300 [Mycobacterium haemophilum DSM 44634]KLO32138.1 hypothetical protein ABH39_07275 [Mycobacterium haemophilum]KLO36545.1 hypothetical protein ABH38_11190 [Mycobacterium haemophilum]KLO42471.1 hypothetical protein ABH37_09815 [Mycobacterium haemophilum]KLO55348.1 hypothetical protein ABH36_06795 [Mycobacterium haemophilum]